MLNFLILTFKFKTNFGSSRPEVSFNFIKKESLAQVFSCEFCEISKNTFFYRASPVAASATYNNAALT